MKKIKEYTYGGHIYMKMMLDNGRIEEIDVYFDMEGKVSYVTSADHRMELDLVERTKIRNQIIDAFNKLY